MTSTSPNPNPTTTTQSCSQPPASNILVKEKTSPLTPDHPSIPRSLSIRFAPLPDPRASRANFPGRVGQLDVWWSRIEKPDGTWGDYRLVLRRPDGQIIAIDDLEPGSDERIQALESHRQQQSSRPSPSPLGSLSKFSFWDPDSHLNSNLLNSHALLSSDPSYHAIARPLLSTLCTPSSNMTISSPNSNLHSAGSIGSINPLTLTPPASCDSTHSNISYTSNQKTPVTSSVAKKFLDAMKKPIIRHSHRLTPTNSLPINGDYIGEPLHKTRSVDSTNSSIRKKFSFGFSRHSGILRRTRSKDESMAPFAFDEPPVRRRSNYPPVAQRKAHMGGGRGGAGKVVLAEEPEFVEWKPTTAATPRTAASLQKPDPSVDDDGSGMAWLRKRKREREERARREEEERAQFLSDALKAAAPVTTADEIQLVSDDAKERKLDEIDSDTGSTNHAGNTTATPEVGKKDDDRDSSASSIYESSILSRDGVQASGGTRTSTSSATLSSKDFNAEEDEDLNEEELKEEERLKALALSQSPFVKGASEVFSDRGHHQIFR